MENHGVSAAQAAAAMGYKRPDMVYRLLRDEANPSLDALQKLADHINVPVGDLLPNSGANPVSDELRDILAAISGVAGRDRTDVIAALAVNARVLGNAYRRQGELLSQPGREISRDITPVARAPIHSQRPNNVGSGYVVEMPQETNARADHPAADSASQDNPQAGRGTGDTEK